MTTAPTNETQTTLSNSPAVTNTIVFRTPNSYPTALQPPREMEVKMADLDGDAFRAPVSALVDLWVAKYGNEWVDLDTVSDDPFFGLAYKRLRSLGELELHYLTDRARYVCRKPE